MQKIKIETTQNVQVDYVLAGLGSRILAYILDTLILVSYVIVLGLIFNWLSIEPSPAGIISLALPAFLYHPLCESLLDGQTIGKRQMQIKVIRLDGSPAGIGAYLLRWLLRPVDITLASGGIAVLSIAMTTHDQRLGDLAAGTTVIKLKPQETTSVFAIDDNHEPAFPEVINLSDADIDTILRVIKVYRETGNNTPVQATAAKVQSLLQIRSDLRPLQFLYTVVRDYKYLTSR